jgi:uncharacterized protein YigE (DUF2233 family)
MAVLVWRRWRQARLRLDFCDFCMQKLSKLGAVCRIFGQITLRSSVKIRNGVAWRRMGSAKFEASDIDVNVEFHRMYIAATALNEMQDTVDRQ